MVWLSVSGVAGRTITRAWPAGLTQRARRLGGRSASVTGPASSAWRNRSEQRRQRGEQAPFQLRPRRRGGGGLKARERPGEAGRAGIVARRRGRVDARGQAQSAPPGAPRRRAAARRRRASSSGPIRNASSSISASLASWSSGTKLASVSVRPTSPCRARRAAIALGLGEARRQDLDRVDRGRAVGRERAEGADRFARRVLEVERVEVERDPRQGEQRDEAEHDRRGDHAARPLQDRRAAGGGPASAAGAAAVA